VDKLLNKSLHSIIPNCDVHSLRISV